MKKRLSLLLAVLLLLSLTACRQTPAETPTETVSAPTETTAAPLYAVCPTAGNSP